MRRPQHCIYIKYIKIYIWVTIYIIMVSEYLRSSNVCYSLWRLYRVAYVKTAVRKLYTKCNLMNIITVYFNCAAFLRNKITVSAIYWCMYLIFISTVAGSFKFRYADFLLYTVLFKAIKSNVLSTFSIYKHAG